MPGSISNAYDPEWGTTENGHEIYRALRVIYHKLSKILDEKPPIYILDLVQTNLPNKISATLTEKEWRTLRFAVERAIDYI